MKSAYLKLWQELFRLILSHKWLFSMSVFIYFLGIIIVLFMPVEIKSEQILYFIDQIGYVPVTSAASFKLIAITNINACFITIISGVLLFPPLLSAFFNGLVVGAAMYFGSLASSAFAIALIAPHGVIELPVLFTANFLGLLVGAKTFFKNKVRPRQSRKRFIFNVLKLYCILLIPLLVVAAAVEAYVTASLIPVVSSIAAKPPDETLNRLLINENDLHDLSLVGEKIEANTQIPCQVVLVRESLVAATEKGSQHSPNESRPFNHVAFQLNQDSYVSIYMLSDNTITPERLSDSFNRRLEKFSALNIKVDTLSLSNSYMSKIKDLTCYVGYGAVNGYYSAILYQGTDVDQFSQISNVQLAKLASASAVVPSAP